MLFGYVLTLNVQTCWTIACTAGEGAVIGESLVNPPGSVGVIRWDDNDKSKVRSMGFLLTLSAVAWSTPSDAHICSYI